MSSKRLAIAETYVIYQSLVTNRQRQICERYFFEDHSLTEIAEALQITRSAVQSTIKRVESLLKKWEEQLAVYQTRQLLARLKEQVSSADQDEINNIIGGKYGI